MKHWFYGERVPSTPYTDAEIDADFESGLRRGGIVVAPERRPVLRESYLRLLEMVSLLDEPQGYTDEPAVVLHLVPTIEAPR